MEHDFWHRRWQNNEIGFHEALPNPALVDHLHLLDLSAGARIFVPLCGKTHDIAWLLSQGYRVVGAELSQIAVEALFEQLDVTPRIDQFGPLLRYSSEQVEIWQGDLFELDSALLGTVDAVYDRAALIALPETMRGAYARHVSTVSAQAPQLLVVVVYDQTQIPGPPFSLSNEEVKARYQDYYHLELVSDAPIEGGLKGKVEALTRVWYLNRSHSV